jgi:hypothetical protein
MGELSRANNGSVTNQFLGKQFQPKPVIQCPRFGSARTFGDVGSMSALPQKADIARRHWHVRLVPQADACTTAKVHDHSITSLASNRMEVGMVMLKRPKLTTGPS